MDCNKTVAHTLYFIHSRWTLCCLTTMNQVQYHILTCTHVTDQDRHEGEKKVCSQLQFDVVSSTHDTIMLTVPV